ncbi:hypothetical protein G6011_00008 [Alternaria panax]|uniref:Uncharacterized protein n=1 Tax=Alternaria panax TaxID=48097 RepID=A0AAD4F7N0_9PLEO|nr:hypothetical protein G6011_00008 [Alternaria panax]
MDQHWTTQSEISRRDDEIWYVQHTKAIVMGSYINRPQWTPDKRETYTACRLCNGDSADFGAPPDYENTKQHTTTPSNPCSSVLARIASFRADTNNVVSRSIAEPDPHCIKTYELVLRRFFKNSAEFRAKQGACNALITGSVIRRILGGYDISDAQDLVIVVQEDHVSYFDGFLRSEGYQMNEEHPGQYVATASGHNQTRVTLVRTQGPAVQYILNLRSSAMMNFATWCKLYSLWPNQTYRNKKAYLFYHNEEEICTDRALEDELKKEGITIRTEQISQDEKAELTRLRHVGDKESWIVPLDPIDEPTTRIPDEVLQVTSFQFRQGHSDHNVLSLRPLYVVRHPDLQHEYLVVGYFSARNERLCGIYDHIMSVLRRPYWERWKAIPEEQRPSDWKPTLVDLECVSHSWIDFWNYNALSAFTHLSQLQEKDTNAQQVLEKSEKKDAWFIEQLHEIKRAYSGWELEPRYSASFGTLVLRAVLGS